MPPSRHDAKASSNTDTGNNIVSVTGRFTARIIPFLLLCRVSMISAVDMLITPNGSHESSRLLKSLSVFGIPGISVSYPKLGSRKEGKPVGSDYNSEVFLHIFPS